jgi:hypothetical protein
MALGFLADRERLDRRTIHPALVRHGTSDGVGAHGEAPDPLGMDAGLPEDSEHLQPEEELALGGEGGTTGVDVIGGARAAGEDEFPHFQGPLHEELSETMSVFHSKEIRPFASGVKGVRRRFPSSLAVLGLLVLALVLAGCEGATTVVPAPHFGQVGEIRVDVQMPLSGESGRLDGILVWRSDGRWILAERLSFQRREGDQTLVSSRGNPGELAQEYASLITQLNETPGLRLLGEVDPSLNPECSPPRSRVLLTIADERQGEVIQWTRCADGSLFTLTPGGAGPDPAAARVITAAQLVRFFTLGDAVTSAFQGTVPFGSLDVGDDSPARPDGPRAFVSLDGRIPPDWQAFWMDHMPEASSAPEVDWDREMILLAAVGRREEAGHRVRVRRVLPLGTATQVEIVEEVPGDFCSPAARTRYPFHIVVAPRGPLPVRFADPVQNRVPCG